MLRHIGIAVGLYALCACQQSEKWRELFHPEEVRSSTLRVEVEPNEGITILLDGQTVSHVAPYIGEHLTAGQHTLEVRAMGYYPIILPIVLKKKELLRVPVVLRQREPEYEAPPPPPSIVKRDPLPPAPPPLPPVVMADSPVTLEVASEPKQLLRIDGHAAETSRISLERVEGMISVGSIQIGYRQASDGLLVFRLPKNLTCLRDMIETKPGQAFNLAHGATRLQCTLPDGLQQAILLRRQ
jgi:hypothetical protein